jgi:hypothetical protein
VGAPSSDAIVLFDGRTFALDAAVAAGRGKEVDAKWTVENGYFESRRQPAT